MNENNFYPPQETPPAPQEVQPGISIAPEINPNVQSPKKSRLPLLAGLAGGIVLVLAIIFVGYAKGYSLNGLSVTSPNKAWEKFYNSSSAKIYNTAFKAGYSDPEALEDGENGFEVALKNIKVDFEGTTYANLSEPAKPEVDGAVKFSVGSGNSSFSSGMEYRAKNNNLFYKVGDIPFISALLGTETGSTDWVKIDLEKAKSGSSSETGFFDKLADPAFEEKIKAIWLDNRAIKLDKYVGREAVNGVNTFHFRAQLDKEATKKAALQTIAEVAALDDSAAFSNENQALADAAIQKLLSKIEVKELDVWIGIKDQNLYKMKLVSNAPSFVSFLKSAQTQQPPLDESATMAQKQKQLEDFLDKLQFSGTFSFEVNYSDYGKIKPVEEPAGALDLLGGTKETGSPQQMTQTGIQ